jgi:hypothetical protein
MTTWGHRALAAGAIVVSVMSSGAGCFKPTIQDGGLLCAGGADGGACPEGFHCSANGTCRSGPKPQCSLTMPHLAPICAADPGTDCDPICQSRCDCGRCTYNGTGLVCLPAGNKPRGAICTPGTDECAPGNFCRRDCGNRIARCYRFCGNDGSRRADVCDGQDCQIFLNDALGNPTELAVCDPPPQACNPVGDNNDCGNAELGCYIQDTTGATVCDCKGAGAPGGGCDLFNSCSPGFRCLRLGASATATCVKTCRRGGTDCAPNACTAVGSGDFGFCMP